MHTFLNPAEVRATLLRLAACAGVLLLASWVDLGGLLELIEDSLANPAALNGLLGLFDVDEVMLAVTARPAGLWRSAPGVVPGLAGLVACVAAVVLARRIAGAPRPVPNLAFRAFALCQERRATSLHYTSEQFWLRIRGR